MVWMSYNQKGKRYTLTNVEQYEARDWGLHLPSVSLHIQRVHHISKITSNDTRRM